MRKIRLNVSWPRLVAFFLLTVGSVWCSSDLESASFGGVAPSKPSIAPTGPGLVLQPGMTQNLHASSRGAERFAWALHGDGKLSSGTGDTVVYTAPDHGGSMALVTVIAFNRDGASPQSSLSISTAAPVAPLAALGIPA